MNRLAEICDRMGLRFKDLAAAVGVAPSAAWQALADPPPRKALAAYLAIAEHVGVVLRVPSGPALAVWIDAKHIEALYRDGDFRRLIGLDFLPVNRHQLRRLVKKHLGRGRSYGYVVRRFNKHHVCTVEGRRQWRRSTIGQIVGLDLRRRLRDRRRPLVPRSEALRAWREQVLTWLLARLIPHDPMAYVRYKLSTRHDGGRILITSEGKMPAKPREWILATLRAATWLEGHWGELPTTEPATDTPGGEGD